MSALATGPVVAGPHDRFHPGRVLAVELDVELPTIDRGPNPDGEEYGFALVLVRWHGTPIGRVRIDLTAGSCGPGALRAAIDDQLGPAIADHHLHDRGSVDDPSGSLPAVSVVIPTYLRPDLIIPCVESVLANDYPNLEVVIVDNGPDDPRTKAAVDERFGTDPRVRYLVEARPGPSAARNTGLRAAMHDVVAFTDDDVITDPGWLRNLTTPLHIDPDLACVTGLTEPYELETEAQMWFEQYGGLGGGYRPRRLALDMAEPPTLLFPFTSGAGASNNMAIRRATALALGGFDLRLGPGTPTLAGEDLDLFVRLLLDGQVIHYEPEALVWHRHRRTEKELLGHVHGYGVGSTAVLAKWFARSPALRAKVFRHAVRLPAAFGTRELSDHDVTRPPARIARSQLRGGLIGPLRWARSRTADTDEGSPRSSATDAPRSGTLSVPTATDPGDITAVVCTYTEDRWDQFVAAIDSLRTQTARPGEVIAIIDHAPALAQRARRELPDVRVVENAEAQGLSGGRNTALRVATTPLVAFLDDDAVADPQWLARLGAHFDDPHVLGAGGRVTPNWQDHRPAWFPREFDWVLGCTYRGVPERLAEVRNPFGGAMVIRRDQALTAGGYRTDLGRVGSHPAGCEETELCMRLRTNDPTATFLYDPDAEIHHFAPRARCTWAYFRGRCFAEGRSKAIVRSLSRSTDGPRNGPHNGLSTERGYVMTTLPTGVARGLLDAVRGRGHGLARAAAISAGLAWTIAGFLVGTLAGQRRGSTAPEAAPTFRPAWVGAVDLDGSLEDVVAPPTPSGGRYARALVVALLHRQPIGVIAVELDDGRLPSAALRDDVVAKFEPEIAAHLDDDESELARCWFTQGEPNRLPSFSIVLCTRNRPEQAELAIAQLLEIDYPDFELVVVDNAPSDDETQRAVAAFALHDPRVRYVREPVPGLANARNCGIAVARGEMVAFTDDDIRVPTWWLRSLARGFERTPQVVCVTGAVMSAALDTRAEELFDQAVASGAKWGFQPRLFRPDDPSPTSVLFPYQVGVYGGGGNAAFVREYLVRGGGFDPALGAGTATRGGEDLDVFLQVMVDGQHLAYEPGAFVWHLHHTDDREVRTQAFHYGVGLGAFLFKIACTRTHAPRMLARAPQGLRYFFGRSSGKNAQKSHDFPLSLTACELLGIACGPLAYVRSRRRFPARRTGVPGEP